MIYLLRRRGLGKTSCKGIAAQSKVDLRVFRSDKRLPDAAEMVFRWGCIATLPAGTAVVNTARAISVSRDKRAFRMLLDEQKLCPKTWTDAVDVVFPAVVRPQFHTQGKRLYVVRTQQELGAATAACGANWYAGAFIDKVAEYRVYVAQGRVIGVARKYPANVAAIAWNVAQGGRFEVCRWGDWPLKTVRHALQGFALSGLDFGGVDTMVDVNGKDYILELNSAPSLTSTYRQTSFANVFDWMTVHGKETIPLVGRPGGYRKFIHPAVCGEALLA